VEPQIEAGRDPLIAEIWGLLEPVIAGEAMELIEADYRRESPGWVLRLFIDKDGGITVDDCARMSRIISDILDVADLIPNSYTLEVSSPGLNRPLRKWEHFRDQIGKVVDIRTVVPLGSRRNFKGILKEAAPERAVIDCSGQVFEIPLPLVERARLLYFESLER
jgi:ribosome maturation factor RimP